MNDHTCGACGETRSEENIEMKEHANSKLGKFPICTDKPCTIDDVNDPTDTTPEYKVTDKLE